MILVLPVLVYPKRMTLKVRFPRVEDVIDIAFNYRLHFKTRLSKFEFDFKMLKSKILKNI